MATRVRSNSKINLGLAIGPIRDDGFHALTTLYQTLEAHDFVTLSTRPLGARERSLIRLHANDPRVPVDGRNTIWKMLEQALALPCFAGQGWAVDVEIDKRLPVQGGLGAGSANAAAALLALERETGIAVAGAERLRIAAAVGSDVPLFLVGGAVLGLGRGEQVFPMPDLVQAAPTGGTSVEVLLALPETGVSTPRAFRDWDAAAAGADKEARPAGASLTAPSSSGTLRELSRAFAAALCEPHASSGVFPSVERRDLAGHPLSALVRTGIRNDFEQVVFRQYPFLGTIKRALLGFDGESAGESASACPPSREALYAALSGSGSALFGLYADADALGEAEARLKAMGVCTMRTTLLTRAAYWEQVFAPQSGMGQN